MDLPTSCDAAESRGVETVALDSDKRDSVVEVCRDDLLSSDHNC